MGLNSIDLKYSYRSDLNNIYEEFYFKCLENSIKYDRATGYFTSNSLSLMAEGLEKFLWNSGKIRMVASPKLTEEDLMAIEKGEKNKMELIEKVILKELIPTKFSIEKDTLNVLAWLIENNILEIKLSFLKENTGIYHEKFGIFYSNDGSKVAFTGSVNETQGGIQDNFESLDVYSTSSGESEVRRIEEKVINFENLWNNTTNKLEVIDFPKVAKEKILSYKATYPKCKEKVENNKEIQKFSVPSYLEIRDYQKQAFNNWRKNGGKGILEMATGTGKTITTLYILSELYKISKETNSQTIFLVVCPYKQLIHQWEEEFKSFGAESICCFSDNKTWKKDLKNLINCFNMNLKDNLNILVTQDSLYSHVFIDYINEIVNRSKMVLIVDECHNIGTENFFKNFSKIRDIPYKLGLSATPDRQSDIYGNEIIKKILGEKIFEFTLEKAIEQNYLTNYYYYPILIELTESEKINYYDLTFKINKIICSLSEEEREKNDSLKLLLIKRSRIIQLAENKCLKLKELLKKNKEFKNLIYVGAGKRLEEEEKEIIKITKMMGLELELKVAKFTAEESSERRDEIIENFISEKLNAIVAIKCLDEGVNIPCIETAYILGSTTNKREYIQRRGRILRKAKGKEYAYIYDFIVIPCHYSEAVSLPSDIFNLERNILKKELERVNEYAELCENKYSYLDELIEYKKSFNLLDY
ncbi:MAG: DEAD/DEAH box helicase family protein [Fusobacteriaceae bacterium]